jgi:hypothetical protein
MLGASLMANQLISYGGVLPKGKGKPVDHLTGAWKTGKQIFLMKKVK